MKRWNTLRVKTCWWVKFKALAVTLFKVWITYKTSWFANWFFLWPGMACILFLQEQKNRVGLNYKLEKVPLPQSNGLNGGRKNN